MSGLLHATVDEFRFIDWILGQVDLFFCLTRGYLDFFVKMVIVGVKRKMGELLVRHMSVSRFVLKVLI